MLTQTEIDVLIMILQRAPINKAEALAIDAIVQKLIASLSEQPKPEAKESQ